MIAEILSRTCSCGQPVATQAKNKFRCARCQIRHEEKKRKERKRPSSAHMPIKPIETMIAVRGGTHGD